MRIHIFFVILLYVSKLGNCWDVNREKRKTVIQSICVLIENDEETESVIRSLIGLFAIEKFEINRECSIYLKGIQAEEEKYSNDQSNDISKPTVIKIDGVVGEEETDEKPSVIQITTAIGALIFCTSLPFIVLFANWIWIILTERQIRFCFSLFVIVSGLGSIMLASYSFKKAFEEFSDQLKVFFVGGPNSRKDYHIEEGEEVFYQRHGDMVLKVLEKGIMKDLVIREGELFVLPSRVEHSPQRFSNMIGFVVERLRENTEFDCVRYFAGHSTVRLYERWFHLTDVVKDLPPLIKKFHESEEFKREKPGEESFKITAPYEPRFLELAKPINLKKFIADNARRVAVGPLQIFGAPEYTTEVNLLGKGTFDMRTGRVELLIWIQEDSFGVVMHNGTTLPLQADTMARLKPNTDCVLEVIRGNAVTIRMDHS